MAFFDFPSEGAPYLRFFYNGSRFTDCKGVVWVSHGRISTRAPISAMYEYQFHVPHGGVLTGTNFATILSSQFASAPSELVISPGTEVADYLLYPLEPELFGFTATEINNYLRATLPGSGYSFVVFMGGQERCKILSLEIVQRDMLNKLLHYPPARQVHMLICRAEIAPEPSRQMMQYPDLEKMRCLNCANTASTGPGFSLLSTSTPTRWEILCRHCGKIKIWLL